VNAANCPNTPRGRADRIGAGDREIQRPTDVFSIPVGIDAGWGAEGQGERSPSGRG